MSVEALLATGEKLALLNASGPDSDVTVASGSTANVDLTISRGPVSKILEHLAVKELSGLPTGVVPAGFSYPNSTTLRIVAYNPTTAAVTVTSGSVSAKVLVKAL